MPLGRIVMSAAIGALARGFHIALGRALGYGPRTPDGFQSAYASARPLPAGINEGAPVVGASQIEIDAPPQLVWDVLTAFEGWPSWNADVKSVSAEGDVAEGSVFRWKAGPGTVTSTIRRVDQPWLI